MTKLGDALGISGSAVSQQASGKNKAHPETVARIDALLRGSGEHKVVGYVHGPELDKLISQVCDPSQLPFVDVLALRAVSESITLHPTDTKGSLELIRTLLAIAAELRLAGIAATPDAILLRLAALVKRGSSRPPPMFADNDDDPPPSERRPSQPQLPAAKKKDQK